MDQDCVDAAAISDTQNSETLKREWEAQMFRCSSPQNSLMCDEEDRMRTFPASWCDEERPTPREMVDAGFYYKGSGDRVLCFYCGGGLFYWKPHDNPWYEHAKWFPMCEFVLKKQGINYVEKVCQKHSDLHRPGIKNPTRTIAANHLRSMLFDQMRNNAAAKQRNKKLEDLMLFDPHVKYAKSIGVEDTKIRYALLNQMEKNQCNFSNRQELLNAVLDFKKDDKCLKCKNAEKNAVCMPCGHMVLCWTCVQDTPSCWLCSQWISEKIRVFQC